MFAFIKKIALAIYKEVFTAKPQPVIEPEINYKEFQGFKLIADSKKTKYVRNHIKRTKKVIFYNPIFIAKLNNYQIWFLFRWCVVNARFKDIWKSDQKVYEEALKKGYDTGDIVKLYEDFMRDNKEQNKKRILFMLTTPTDKKVLRFFAGLKNRLWPV